MKLTAVAIIIAMLSPLAAHATLGAAPSAPAASASTPAKRLSALPATPAAPYTMRESHSADGVTIHEYVTPGNIVFAVTWDGPTRPDMTALLGSYFPNFVQAGSTSSHGIGSLVNHTGDLVIESFGRPGSALGKAYLPRLVPAGVNPAALQ
ncbi:DUF2844 domain-containing protein [Paraburkholderia bonniea]|uniref:DUF2844 domain-containing protein n=1 Tax=Paraburkholderia bonniea TaxID=2152891 RepID=UPI0025738C19|nr:DUF2844 domain-containing protein [Paraburkholderia bonniea]WJF89569.1 DUF2844 domain-containing protein [Paraburkholderia bonniea]WJF92883.1 DUF2844 domain-containing protein [Paraburkholderia bonniea]